MLPMQWHGSAQGDVSQDSPQAAKATFLNKAGMLSFFEIGSSAFFSSFAVMTSVGGGVRRH